MKFLIISDTHGRTNAAVNLITNEKPDYCIHLGDVSADCDDLMAIFPRQKFICVKGNNEFWLRNALYPDERIFTLAGKKFFLCHGHKFHVKFGLSALKEKARELCADIVLYGHTHQQYFEQTDELLVMNPGSVGGYGIIELENGIIKRAELHKE